MSDLEKEEVYVSVSEHLDSIDEIMDNYDFDIEDAEFIELGDLFDQIRKLISRDN